VARHATRKRRIADLARRLARRLPRLRLARLGVVVAALAGAACSAGGSGTGPAIGPADGGEIRFRDEDPGAPCGAVQFRASTPAGMRLVPLAELVVAVNGRVCHREGVPGRATVYGELVSACPEPDLYQPGPNLVEAVLFPPDSGARGSPLARRRTLCSGPDRD
jgi:hypothetical protein